MSKFDYYLNKQGPRGPQGIQGEQGFSPIITVATNTLSEYVLQIQTQNSTFLTANLREHKDDLGGTYIRLNRETGVMYAGDADMGSQSQYGVVRFATASDIERQDSTSVVSPADVINIVGSAPEDISRLEDRVDDLEAETESLEIDISTNTNAISELQSSVVGLLESYVPKSRTINGHNLGSNVTLTASDVSAYSKSETDAILAAKADVSDLPNMNNYYNTTQIDLMLNEKADISDIPAVGNGTITINQGGVQRGQFSVNQSGDVTIALDAGGSQYILPAATTSTLGGVIVDGTTITVNSNGVITSVGGGGGGTTYNPGNGININSSTNTISAKPDGTTIDFNTNGELKVISAPTPNNMVTTDTDQTITGIKTIGGNTAIYGTRFFHPNDKTEMYIGSSGKTLYLGGSVKGNYQNSAFGDVVFSNNITDYLPTASTSTLGGVKVDGTTITVDANGVISSSGSGSIDTYTKAETDAKLAKKQDVLTPNAPLTISSYIKSNIHGFTYATPTSIYSTSENSSEYYSPRYSWQPSQGGDVMLYARTSAWVNDTWSTSEDSFKAYIDIPIRPGQVVVIPSSFIGYLGTFNDNGAFFPKNGIGCGTSGMNRYWTDDINTYTSYGTVYLFNNSSNTMGTSVSVSSMSALTDYIVFQMLEDDTTTTIISKMPGSSSPEGYKFNKSNAPFDNINTLRVVRQNSTSGYDSNTAIDISKLGLYDYDGDIADFSDEGRENLFDISGEQAYKYLDLHIGAGLAVQGGNLVNTNPTAPTVMTGATSSTAGTAGLAPAPAAGDDTKFLSGDGTYKVATTDLSNYYNKGETDALLDKKQDVMAFDDPLTYSQTSSGANGVELANNQYRQTGNVVPIGPTDRSFSAGKIRIPTLGSRGTGILGSDQFYYIGDVKSQVVKTTVGTPTGSYEQAVLMIGHLDLETLAFTPKIMATGLCDPGSWGRAKFYMAAFSSTTISYGDSGTNDTVFTPTFDARNSYGSYYSGRISNISLSFHKNSTNYLEVRGAFTHTNGYSANLTLTTTTLYDESDINCVLFNQESSSSWYSISDNGIFDSNDNQIWKAGETSAINSLHLKIGAGLAIQDGNLVNTNPTSVTVDQTFDASSTNAQSGTAVAEAVANKVTGTGITNMVALTQAQYDALATKDANTFYVIVAASS